jgi:hypothetical protein
MGLHLKIDYIINKYIYNVHCQEWSLLTVREREKERENSWFTISFLHKIIHLFLYRNKRRETKTYSICHDIHWNHVKSESRGNIGWKLAVLNGNAKWKWKGTVVKGKPGEIWFQFHFSIQFSLYNFKCVAIWYLLEKLKYEYHILKPCEWLKCQQRCLETRDRKYMIICVCLVWDENIYLLHYTDNVTMSTDALCFDFEYIRVKCPKPLSDNL